MNLLLRPKYHLGTRHRRPTPIPTTDKLLELLRRQRLDDELIALLIAATTD